MTNIKLSPHFTLQEMTRTSQPLPNNPTAEHINNLAELCRAVLEVARKHYGAPIFVLSGYRSPQVNQAVGGVRNSQHQQGKAVDIHGADNVKLFNILRDKCQFDQLIKYHNSTGTIIFIHVSHNGNRNRNQVLSKRLK